LRLAKAGAPFFGRAAATCGWLLATGGAIALGTLVTALAALSSAAIWQIAAGSSIAALVGMFPLRIPRTKTSIAAGDIFIFLLLLVHGPFAAVIAATDEANTGR
jgi:hypothetical protein